MPNNLLRQPNFAALVTLVWLLVALALLLQYWTQTAETLLDTDDAMRLAQLRGWLGGQGWFDLHQARMQPPEGYDTHWSRLIDAGLAGLLFLFGLFTDGASAERLMRAWWPLLWLLPTIAGMAAIAWRIAGREAATVALLLALVGVPAYQQFTPGRIDHHNVQIALTHAHRRRDGVVGPRGAGARPRRACSPALALAIGFECGALSRGLRRACSRCAMWSTATAPAISLRMAGGWRRVRSRASSPPSGRSIGCATPATASPSTRSPR